MELASWGWASNSMLRSSRASCISISGLDLIMSLPPANDLISKRYSLEPDMATGWRPKAKVVGPVPLNFEQLLVDQIAAETSRKLVFLGFRPTDTFSMHKVLGVDYRFKYEHLYQNNFEHLKAFFKKFYASFQPATKFQFTGMNPNARSKLIFDSIFESGNLDCVLQGKDNTYDLFMRIDSNTKGHNNWFNFKVKNL
jgi:hypothetical protein